MIPQAAILLVTPTSGGFQDITKYISLETNPVLTTIIEDPTTTAQFVAPDVTLKGYDPTGFVQGLMSGLLPTSQNFGLRITLSLIGPPNVVDYRFDGFIAPSTYRTSPQEKSFSFTAIGFGRLLQTTPADALFQRPNYKDGRWYLVQDVTPLDKSNVIRIQNGTTSGGLNGCQFQAGDQIQIMGNETFTVTGVYPDPGPVPVTPPQTIPWNLVLDKTPSQKYPANPTIFPPPDPSDLTMPLAGTAPSYVNLLTKYARNVRIQDAVSTLFNAIGLPVANYYGQAALPNLGSLFASPVNTGGLPEGPTSIVPDITGATPSAILAGTTQGLYASPDPSSLFSLQTTAITGALVDGTNYFPFSAGFAMIGEKRTKTRITGPRYGLNVSMKFYGYDFLAGNKRYILTVTCNADVNGFTFGFTSKLESETFSGGAWGGTTLISNIESNTTTTDLSRIYDALGIDVDPATGTVFFTDPTVAGVAGDGISINLSSYVPSTSTLTRNRVSGVNGPVIVTSPGIAAVFQIDGVLGKDPKVFVYSLSSSGVMTQVASNAVSPFLVPRSIKKNGGDGRWYGLISDQTNGIYLTSWASEAFAPDAAHPDTLILPPPPGSAQAKNLGGRPWAVDLIVLKQAFPGTTYPMVSLVAGVPMLISNQGAGFVAYMDTSAMSVADALQSLTTLNAGIFYVEGSLWNFRTRSSPKPGETVANPAVSLDDVIDDVGMINISGQPVFNRWVGYVKISNENDSTIFGEAGSAAFANSPDLSLDLQSRYVSSKSFATALATSLFNYIGAQKRWVEIEHIRDGRLYQVGRTFRATLDGAQRTFQVIESRFPVFGGNVYVVGLEV